MASLVCYKRLPRCGADRRVSGARRLSAYWLPYFFLGLLLAGGILPGAGSAIAALLLLIALFLLGDWLFGSARPLPVARLPQALYRLLPRLCVPLLIAAILWTAAIAARPVTDGWHFAGLVLATGAGSGIFGMLSAHELIHSRSRFDRRLGLAMLIVTSYPQFRIAHLHGHHRHAATPLDAATARAGEGAYRFVLRSVTGQFRFAWTHERRRAGRRGNRLLAALGAVVLLYVALGLAFGLRADFFTALQSLLAIFILELFNYVAHYGLARRRQADGRYEPLGPQHSWNTLRRFSNWALLNAGGHREHHAAPTRPFTDIAPAAGGPELPAGFAGCILLALLPPLWHRVMQRRLGMPASTWT